MLPTYNRADALCANLENLLAVEGVDEIVVVDDGSSDDTAELLSEVQEPRLRVIRLPVNQGLPAARNAGIDAASARWVLFTEDDCRFPRDYAITLLEEARSRSADIVGAPWMHLSGRPFAEELAARRAVGVDRLVLDEHAFPMETIVTPFAPAPALFTREVFEHVRFSERYRGNTFREETDFFIRAMRAGFVCVLTPATCSYQVCQFDGGTRSSRPRYEYWTLRNNWHFLRRHGPWLLRNGYLGHRGLSDAQIAFAARRLRTLAKGFVGARVRGLRAAATRV